MRARKLAVECPRCAYQQEVDRAGHYPDRLFLEVWRERFELEQQLEEMERRARRAEARLQSEEGESAYWRKQHSSVLDHLLALSKAALKQAKEAETI